MNLPRPAIADSIPYKLHKESEELNCFWLNVEGVRFMEPFFDDTILKCRALPQNRHPFKCMSQVSHLPALADEIPAVAPAALLFHVSRCGSTMLSQLLALDNRNIVLPEVPFFDEILRLQVQDENIPVNTADNWLRAAVNLYGKPKDLYEQHVFIKTDCWHIFFWERWRKLYPCTPFILLYRSPDEVLRSQQKRRGIQAVPGLLEPGIFNLDQAEINYLDFDHYFSMVLERIFEKFLQVSSADEQTTLINYKEGMIPAVKEIATVCNLDLADDLLEIMTERTRYHAKYPDQTFSGDGEISVSLPDLTRSLDYYQQLEQIRVSRIQ